MSNKTVNSSEVLQGISDALTGLVKGISPSVVRVGAGRGSGTGIVWGADGTIVTSNHVIDGASSIEVGLGDGNTVEAKVVGQDNESDVAVLKIEGAKTNLQPIKKGDSDRLEVGQLVIAVANAFGGEPAATFGIVTSPRRSFGWGRRGRGMWGRGPTDGVVVTDARLNPGYSGGPLVDSSGRMVGLNAAYAFSRGLAVPVNVVASVADKLGKEGRIRRGYLGVILNEVELPEETAKQLGQEDGLMVLGVSKDTPAKKAGVAMGDVIVKLDGNKVEDLYDLQHLLTDEVIGKEVELTVLRSEKMVDLKITPSDVVPQ
jgi:S1-C subfamily serine protease